MKYGERDLDIWTEVLPDLIREKGKKVFEHDWDSGGPGAGAGTEVIYRFQDLYWPDSEVEGIYGPAESLEEALEAGDFLKVTDATTAISCVEISAVELAKMLQAAAGDEADVVFLLNGQKWQLDPNGQFSKLAVKRSRS